MLSGTLLSHGFAILFGSKIAYFCTDRFQFYLKLFTYASFVLFGILGFAPKKNYSKNTTTSSKSSLLQKFSFLSLNCVVMVAFCILVGELGDKTFLASLSLGLEYPYAKLSLILGSVCGMVASNFIAIFCGRLIGNYLKQDFIEVLSNITFLVFGLLGFLHIIF